MICKQPIPHLMKTIVNTLARVLEYEQHTITSHFITSTV